MAIGFAEAGGRESGLHEAPAEVLYHLLEHLVDSENPSGTSTELKDQFLAALKKEFPRERTPVVLIPLLYPERFNLTTDQLNPTSVSLPRTVVSYCVSRAFVPLSWNLCWNL